MEIGCSVKTGFGAVDERSAERIRARILLPFAFLLVFVIGAFLFAAFREMSDWG